MTLETTDSIDVWEKRICASRARRALFEATWAKYARLHTNAYQAARDKNDDKTVVLPSGDQVKVGLVFRNIEQTQALLDIPEIGVRATAIDYAREIGFEDTHRESVVEQALYGSLVRSGIIKEAEEADYVKLDGTIIGHGINYTYWRVEEMEVELDPIPVLTPDPTTGEFVPLVKNGKPEQEIIKTKRTIWEGCQDESISPMQFLTDASCKRLYKSPWHGFERPTKLAELRKDPRYSIPDDIEGTSFLLKDIYGSEGDKDEELTDAVMVIVIWDCVNKELITFIETCPSHNSSARARGSVSKKKQDTKLIPIAVFQKPMQFSHPDHSPFTFFIPIPARDHPFGISQIEHIRVLALEADKIRTRQANITRQIKRIPWFRKGAVDGEQLRRALQSDDLEPVGLDIKEDQNPDHLLGELSTPTISPDIFNQGEFAARDVDKISGVSATPGGGADTATEAEHIFDIGAARPKQKKRRYLTFLTNVCNRHRDYLRTFGAEGELVVVPDMDGRMLTLAYGRKAFEGEFEIEVTAGGGAMSLSPVKQKMVLELNAAVMGKYGPHADLALLRRTLTMFDYPGVNEIMRAASAGVMGGLPAAPGEAPRPGFSPESYTDPQTMRAGINFANES